MSLSSFVKKLYMLKVLFGGKASKIAGISDSASILAATGVVWDTATKTITFTNETSLPSWLTPGKFFRTYDGVPKTTPSSTDTNYIPNVILTPNPLTNDGVLFQVLSVSGNVITVDDSGSGATPADRDTTGLPTIVTLEGRIAIVVNDANICRINGSGSTVYNTENQTPSAVPGDGSGVAAVFADHFHAALGSSSSLYLGWYIDDAALIAAHPVGIDGNYANVGSTDTMWIWDSDTNAWVDSGIVPPIVPPIIDINYITFSHNIGLSTLIKGAKYRITDYQTIHYIPGTTDINSAGVEPLIVTAIDVNKISKHAISETHPEDLIEYDYSLNLAEDGFTLRPGLIVYRKDMVNDVEAYYDWRSYIFRRYEIDQAASNPSGAHYVWSAIPTPTYAFYTGIPTGCSTSVTITAVNSGLVGNTINHILITDVISINDAIANWNAVPGNEQIALPIVGDGTQYSTTGFADIALTGGADGDYERGEIAISPVDGNLYLNLFGNNTGEPSVTKQDWSQIVILGSNNAFVPGIQISNKPIVLNTSAYNNYPTFNGTVRNAHLGVGSIDNVFLGNCKNINIENDCTENTFGTLNDGIILHNNCTKNIFGGWVNFAELGAYSWHNLIGDTTLYSEMKENGSYNVIVGGSSGNRLDYSCSTNIIDLACNNTALGSNCISNTVGAAIDFTRLGNSCKFINIGDGLGNPICVSINIGNNCEYINIPAGSYNVHIPYRVENLDLSPLSGVYNVRFEVGGIHTDFLFPPTGLYNFAGVSFAAATHMSLPYSKVVFTTSAVPWISGNSYNIGNRVIDTVNVYEIYECINPTSGTTEPSADATNWVYYGTTARLKYTDELDNTVITDVNA